MFILIFLLILEYDKYIHLYLNNCVNNIIILLYYTMRRVIIISIMYNMTCINIVYKTILTKIVWYCLPGCLGYFQYVTITTKHLVYGENLFFFLLFLLLNLHLVNKGIFPFSCFSFYFFVIIFT